MAHEMRRTDEADDFDILRRDGPYGYAVFQPLAKALPVGHVEVGSSDSRPIRVAVACPDREDVLKGGDCPLLVLRPIAPKTLPKGNAEVHASCGPSLRITLACPDRKGVLKGGDRPLLILRPFAGKALPVGNP